MRHGQRCLGLAARAWGGGPGCGRRRCCVRGRRPGVCARARDCCRSGQHHSVRQPVQREYCWRRSSPGDRNSTCLRRPACGLPGAAAVKRGESALSGGTTGQLPHESSASVVLPRLRTHVAEERRVAYDDWEAVPDAREGLVSLERHLQSICGICVAGTAGRRRLAILVREAQRRAPRYLAREHYASWRSPFTVRGSARPLAWRSSPSVMCSGYRGRGSVSRTPRSLSS